MKTKMLFLLITGIFLLFSCEFLTFESGVIPIEKPCDDLTEGTVITVQINCPSLEGNILGDPADRSVNIYLPEGYNLCNSKKYPVIYYLHGLPASENSLMDSIPFAVLQQMANLQVPVDFPAEGFTAWVNNLIENEGMKKAIIVMPNASNRYAISFYSNSEVQGNYEDYIVEDLVYYIDSHFKTIPHFNWRAITGHSAGGYGALKIAMKHPRVFRRVAGLSPGIFPDQTVAGMALWMAGEDQMWGVPGPTAYDPSAPFKFANNTFYSAAAAWLPNPEKPPYFVDIPFSYVDGQPVLNEELMAKWNSNSLFALVMGNELGLKKLKSIYFDCGNQDDLYMFLPNQALHEMLTNMNIKHQFEAYDGTHFSNLYDRLGKVFVDLSNDFPGGH